MLKNKLRISICFVLMFCIILLSNSVVASIESNDLLNNNTGEDSDLHIKFSGGSGQPDDPYLLAEKKDLIAFANMPEGYHYYNSHYILTSDIDLGDYAWVPIGGTGPAFAGVFDGNGHRITINNISEKRNYENEILIGLFADSRYELLVKNLTIKSNLYKSLTIDNDTYIGIIAGRSEGTIENCSVEGEINLTIAGNGDINVGAISGRHLNIINLSVNKASITVNNSGKGNVSIGGIAGDFYGENANAANLTNQGSINVNFEDNGSIGGIAGSFFSGKKSENLLNLGNITVKGNLETNGYMIKSGGIFGDLVDCDLNKALNKGNIYVEDVGNATNTEILAGGITGSARNTMLKNLGNEGNIETKRAMYQYPSGITKADRNVKIENAYTKGNVYGSSPLSMSEVYSMGTAEDITANNIYVSGSIKLKEGNSQERQGDYISNIRPGAKTAPYNYCYWDSRFSPFPGYPTLTKPTSTSKPVNVANGKLISPVTVAGKNYSDLTAALNAWVNTQKDGYLTWTDAALPTFNHKFGYIAPEYMFYKNKRDGKWLNTSDWAYKWMDKADKYNIIPDMLLNKDVTKAITRIEFSVLAVRLYENLTDSKIRTTIYNPFTDVNDSDVTKAYSLGIVTGVGNGKFAPEEILSREQASTMLTRVYKAVFWEGWSIENDSTYAKNILDIEGVNKFDDDNLINAYAKESVYFMVKNSIINGLGNNLFAPVPSADKDQNYGIATKEQAFKIAVAMIEKFSQD